MPSFDRSPCRAAGAVRFADLVPDGIVPRNRLVRAVRIFSPQRSGGAQRFVLSLSPLLSRVLIGGLIGSVIGLGTAGCDLFVSSTEPDRPVPICSGWPDWETSELVLPYPVFSTYRITSGNCTGGHLGGNRYGFDWNFPTGRPVTAAHSGTVVFLDTGWPNNTVGGILVNYIVIDHHNGEWGSYFHLSPASEQVSLGQFVNQGQIIALSGASGTRNPHLHFHVKPCELNSDCDSIPITFRNTDPNPRGLQIGRSYTALPYG